MRWSLVLLLSLFGLAMAVATVFWIPSNVEPFFWLVILLIAAPAIAARAPGRFFLHGLALGVVNGVWVTGAHVFFFEAYVARHVREAEMMAAMPSPRLMMALVGPVIGVLSGCVFGLGALAVRRLLGRKIAPTGPGQS